MKSSCVYCGNNPVPHFAHKFYQSFDIMAGPMRRWLFATQFGRISDALATYAALAMFYTLKPLGLIQINTDIEKIPYERAKTLWAEAQARHIPIEEIKPFGQSIDL